MNVKEILELAGGIGLLLYGKQVMSSGLKKIAEHKMKQILELLTANRFLGLAVGAMLTAFIQSSAAAVAMVVGFVSSGMMTLQQAVWVIMGANIGATITAQLVALKLETAIPLFLVAGVALIAVLKKYKYDYIGESVVGFGLFFLGMDVVKEAVLPLQDSQYFMAWMKLCSHPIAGILTGIFLAIALQSLGVSIGILQALAVGGLIGLEGAVFVLIGQNTGAGMRVLWVSCHAAGGGKKGAQIHLLFNMAGMMLFTLLYIFLPLVPILERFTPGNPAGQVANANTLFHMGTALVLLPLGGMLEGISRKIFPGQKGKERGQEKYLKYLPSDGRVPETEMGNSVIYFRQLRQEILRMLEMAQENVDKAFWAFRMKDGERFSEIVRIQEYIIYLNQEISGFISRTVIRNSNGKDPSLEGRYLRMAGSVERIGAHALKIAGYIPVLEEKDISFSREAYEEMEHMEQVLQVLFETLGKEERNSGEWMMRMARLEQDLDDMSLQFRKTHMGRIRQGFCPEGACVVYSEMLMDFERIGQHALDIAQELQEMDLEESYSKGNKTSMRSGR